ncbi:MAG: hypothetical protein KC583_04485 [Myxococcales bacterium]|nr:hypothetical protein [Myxococcales bacterium]
MAGHHKTFTDDPKVDPGVVKKAFTAAIAVGGLGLIASGAAIAMGEELRRQFFFSYLVAFMLCLTIALGALFFTIIHHLTRATWSTGLRRIAENLAGTLPVLAVLFLPILLGLHDLYHWSHEAVPAHDPLIRHKSGYLSTSFWVIRAVVFFGLWTAIALFFRRNSVKQDETGDTALTFKMRKWAPVSTLIFALSISFAGFDWMMSLDPHWFSTMFGVWTFAGSMVSFFAALGLAGLWLTKKGALAKTLTVGNFHDIGKLLFGFIVFWAYISFSQYYLIWYANIPEETAWYLHRTHEGWDNIFSLIIGGHFILPFALLMSRHLKRRRAVLGLACGWMVLMHWVDLYYVIMPTLQHHLHFHWLDVTTVLGVGGVFVAFFVRQFGKDAAVAHRDPQLIASMEYDNA